MHNQNVNIADPPAPALSAAMNIDIDMEKQPPAAPAPVPVQVDWGNHNVWHWKAEDKEKWIPASPVWQKFMDCWVDPIRAADLHQNTFPHELQIFPSSHFEELESTMTSVGAKPLLTSDGRMLVFERHGFLYHSLKRNREQRYRGGVVLGGQPGIGALGASDSSTLLTAASGKSLLLWYFLVRLVQDRQPVLLYLPESASSTILLYNGKAWYPKFDFDFQEMPCGSKHPKNNRSRPIFVLVDSAEQEPTGMTESMGWPIYAMSPRPSRSQEFLNKREPIFWGLDLWTFDQLLHGWMIISISCMSN